MSDPLKGHKLMLGATGIVNGRIVSVTAECKIGESKEEFLTDTLTVIMAIANDERERERFLEGLSDKFDKGMKQIDKMRIDALIEAGKRKQ